LLRVIAKGATFIPSMTRAAPVIPAATIAFLAVSAVCGWHQALALPRNGIPRALSGQAGAIVSDDFHSTELDTTVWRFDDPVGDVTLWMTGTNVVVSIPGGTNHDLRTSGTRAPRLMQDAANTDFDVEGKFDSRGSRTYQGQGIIVQEDADTYLRFEVIFFSGGSSHIYSAYVNGGVRTTKLDRSSVGSAPSYLRVTRTGNSWQYRYSNDGTMWSNGVVFTQTMTVSEVGVYFNAAPVSSDAYWATPAFVGNVDYFFNRASPINPEDDGVPTVPTPPVVEIWYGNGQNFGHLGIPQQWVNILGRVWDTEQVETLFYSLNEGPSSPLTMGPNGTRLVGVGDYNIEIDYADLVPGANQVAITAIDTLGERRDTTVVVNYTGGRTWALPDTARFETAGTISEEAQVVDGRWYLVPGEGMRVDSTAMGYDRLLVLGDYRWETDYEILLPMTIHAGSLGGLTGIGLGLGWQGHTGSDQPRIDAPFQAITWIREFPSNPTLIIEQPGIEKAVSYPLVEANVRYLMRTRSQSLGNGMSRVFTKLWRDGTSEPVNWDLSADVPTLDGSVILIAHRTIVTFGNVEITPVSPLTGIDAPEVVKVLTVRQHYPNPFRHETHVEYGLPKASSVDIAIYDVVGRRVYGERIPRASEGWNQFVFRGKDQNGNALPSGVYFCRVASGGALVTRKIVLVR